LSAAPAHGVNRAADAAQDRARALLPPLLLAVAGLVGPKLPGLAGEIGAYLWLGVLPGLGLAGWAGASLGAAERLTLGLAIAPLVSAMLGAWLAGHGVPHTLVVDNASGHLMQRGMVDLVFVGADRVTRRGDVCNKIGTYLKALAARDNDIPFYAAVPTPTIDWEVEDALKDIPIEERSSEEVRIVRGLDAEGRPTEVAIAPASTRVANPAFDVTPGALVTALITEKGVVRANEKELLQFWPRNQESKAYLT